MKTYDMGDPYGAEESAIHNRRRLAELMLMQGMHGPAFSKSGAVAKALAVALGTSDMRGADEESKKLAGRREAERTADMDKMFEFVNQKGPVVGPGMPQVDDDGNQMPGNVQDTAAKRKELAQALVRARTPQVAQFGLNELLKEPAKPVTYKLGKGEVIKGADGRVIADNPEAPKVEKPQRMEIGGSVIEFGPTGEAKVVYKGEGKRDIRTVGRSVVEITEQGPKVLFTAPKEGGDTHEKAPAGYRWAAGGALEPIPGGPADPGIKPPKEPKVPTEGERSAGGYAIRMEAAEKVLGGVDVKDQKPGIRESMLTAGSTGAGEVLANSLPSIVGGRSPERQMALQAQRDWVRAKLRKESGAVIGESEMENEIRTYFPQIGETDPRVIAQKAAARAQAIEAMKMGAGRSASKPDGRPKRGEVVDGYEYVDGDPANPASWKKR